MILFIIFAATAAVLLLVLAGILYADIQSRLTEVEADDATPAAIVRQVQESTITVRDLRDELARLGGRVDELEARKLSVVEERRAL